MPDLLIREEWQMIAFLTRRALTEIPADHEVADAFRLAGAFSTAIANNLDEEEAKRAEEHAGT